MGARDGEKCSRAHFIEAPDIASDTQILVVELWADNQERPRTAHTADSAQVNGNTICSVCFPEKTGLGDMSIDCHLAALAVTSQRIQE